MKFAEPWYLILAAGPLVVLLWELLLQKRRHDVAPSKILRGEASHATVRLQRADSRRRNSKRITLCLGLALGCVAAARPQWGRIEEPVFDQSREILLAIDLSRSMLAPDVKPTRLDRAKLLIQSLLERLAGERVGMIVFSGTAFLQSPLSADYEILREFLPALNPDYLPEGGTNYEALLKTALTAFSDQGGADRYLIILSDGEANDEAWKPLLDEIEEKGVRIIGLGIGTPDGAMIPDTAGGFVKDDRGAVVLSRLESRTLQTLAEASKGQYVDASSWVDLAELIQQTVEAGKRGEFRETNQIRLAERFQWFLAPSLLLIAWSLCREFPVKPTPRKATLKLETP